MVFDGYLLVPLHNDDIRFAALKSTNVVSSSALRFLIIALILLAVLPSVSVATLLWLSEAAPSGKAPTNHDATTGAIITLPSISLPTTLKATPGENTPFAIAVDGTDPVEGGGTIVISRLPRGSRFSLGSADGETRWKLTPNEIDNLHLVLPETASDETALIIQLLAPDGHVISDAATVIEVTTPEPTIPIRRVKTEVVPGHEWDHPDQASEAMATQADQTMVLQSDLVPLPTKRPEPGR